MNDNPISPPDSFRIQDPTLRRLSKFLPKKYPVVLEIHYPHGVLYSVIQNTAELFATSLILLIQRYEEGWYGHADAGVTNRIERSVIHADGIEAFLLLMEFTAEGCEDEEIYIHSTDNLSHDPEDLQTPPVTPFEGQMWYDPSDKKFKKYLANKWS